MDEQRSYSTLIHALAAGFGLHAVAVVLGAVVLGPGLDFTASSEARAAWIGDHAMLWRLGRAAAQAAAAATGVAGVALLLHVRAAGSSERAARWAAGGALFALLAVGTDGWGMWLAMTDLVDLAKTDSAGFDALQRRITVIMAAKASAAYIAMLWCLTMAAATHAGGWRRHPAFVCWGLTTMAMFLLLSRSTQAVFGGLGADGALVDSGSPLGPKVVSFALLLGLHAGIAIVVGRVHHGRAEAEAPSLSGLLAEPGLQDMMRPLVARARALSR